MKAILRLPDLVSETGLSKTSIWRRVKERTFPEPLKLKRPDSTAVGWRWEDVKFREEALKVHSQSAARTLAIGRKAGEAVLSTDSEERNRGYRPQWPVGSLSLVDPSQAAMRYVERRIKWPL